MRKILLAFFVISITVSVKAQSVLSFRCSRDTLITCPTVSFTLNAKTCDIRQFASGATYSINPMTGTPGSCFAPYIDPGAPGNPVTLNIDDRYSAVIPLGFNFPFFGTVYNSVVVSTNGYISFDITRAGLSSHWQMFGDLPNASYDKALIMGPYHDLDPSEPTSPTQQVKYDVIGSAPHRRFVFSFYKVPLFNCGSLIENTHQIVLYESTGIIEVFIQDKQVCSSWNSGKAMIGLQDITRTQAVMAPSRKASDPSWGSIGMNESWRFVPTGNAAASLLKRVELIDFAGNVVINGITTPQGNGIINVDFPGLTPTVDPANYIVRSIYEKFDNPAIDIIAHDTVIVKREPAPFTVTTTTTDALCNGGTGTITFTNPIGPTYEYSVDAGATWQASPIFPNLPAGFYNVRAREGGMLCSAFGTATINQPPPLTLTSTKTQTNCSNKTGSIILTAGGGTPTYQYSIDGGITYVPGNVFSNLAVGTYSGLQIKDANNCIKTHPPVSISLLDTMRLELGPDSTICFGQKVKMLTQTNAETDTFKWTPTKPLLDYDTVRTPIFSPNDTTKYKVVAKWGLCSRTDDITINVKHKPVPEAGNDTTICYKTFAYLKGSASNLSGTVNYTWTDSSMVSPIHAANSIARPDTTRYFYLTVTDNYGCNFSVVDSVKITMRDPVPAFAGNDTIAMYNKPHQLEATGGVGFIWSPAAPLNNPFARMPLAVLTHDQYFEVKVTDNIGCYAIDGIFVRVYEGPTYHVANAFTPNGDGLNEVFRPIPSGIRSTEYFRVFDRFGTLMFQTQEYLKGWNGTFNGKPALAGTYVWIVKGIDEKGGVVEQKGTVILIR